MTTGDTITLSGLRVRAHHGVYDFERENGQDFVVDLVVGIDLQPASTSDDVAATILWLSSDEAFLTGQNLHPSGGNTLTHLPVLELG